MRALFPIKNSVEVLFSSFGPLFTLGLSRHRQDRVEAALEAYDHLIGQFPESPRRIHAVFERGQALVELDEPGDAAAAFEDVLARAPNSRFAPHALNHLGSIALERDEHAEAGVYFGRAAAALRSGPEGGADMVGEAMFQQGQALMSSQQFGPAVAVLSQLLEEFPSHERRGQASALRAIGFGRRAGPGDHERAVAEIARIEAAGFAGLDASMRTALSYEKAWSLRELERPQEAALAYRAVLEQAGESKLHHHASLELAELEIDADRYDAAADLLRGLRQDLADPSESTRPLLEQGTYNLGLCEFHLGRLEVAADWICNRSPSHADRRPPTGRPGRKPPHCRPRRSAAPRQAPRRRRGSGRSVRARGCRPRRPRVRGASVALR